MQSRGIYPMHLRCHGQKVPIETREMTELFRKRMSHYAALAELQSPRFVGMQRAMTRSFLLLAFCVDWNAMVGFSLPSNWSVEPMRNIRVHLRLSDIRAQSPKSGTALVVLPKRTPYGLCHANLENYGNLCWHLKHALKCKKLSERTREWDLEHAISKKLENCS